MKLSRPRTLLGLILLGLGLVTLPLLLAVAQAALELGELTRESEAVVNESLTATLENQRISSLLTDMERNARQYLVLQDPGLLELYVEDHAALLRSIAFLGRLPQQEQMATALGELASDALAIESALTGRPQTVDVDELVTRFQAMTGAARNTSEAMQVVINDRLAALEETTRATQQTLGWQAAALLPGTGALVIVFLLFVGRPMRQIDTAIRALGESQFSETITISGPRDIETLGRQQTGPAGVRVVADIDDADAVVGVEDGDAVGRPHPDPLLQGLGIAGEDRIEHQGREREVVDQVDLRGDLDLGLVVAVDLDQHRHVAVVALT